MHKGTRSVAVSLALIVGRRKLALPQSVWLFQYLVYFFYYICADFAYFLLFSLEHTRDLDWVTLTSNQSRLLIYLIHLIHFELILDPWSLIRWYLILYSLIQWSGGPWSSFSRKPRLWTVLHLHHILRLNTCVVHGYSAYFDPKTPLTISSERLLRDAAH